MKDLILLSLCLVIITPYPVASNDLLQEVVDKTKKLLKFFSSDYEHINVDGLFGLRLGQGQLKAALQACQIKPECRQNLLEKLRDIETELLDTCNAALPILEANDPDYYKRFLGTTDNPYMMPFNIHKFLNDELSKASVGKGYTLYNEEKGDRCYARVMGTYYEKGRNIPKCNVTKECWDFMTSPDTNGYSITHQLLYFIIVDHVHCTAEVENFIKTKKLEDVQRKMCANIYLESKEFTKTGNVMHHQRDLFLEQTVLCAPLGYEDFINESWIKMTLSWLDHEDGCFKRRMRKDDYETKSGTMRKLLREKNMKDGCLSHTSGLGFGVFSTYLRYFVESMK